MAKIKVDKQLKKILLTIEEDDSIGYDYLTYLSKKEVKKLIKDLTKASEELWQKQIT